MSQMSLYEFQRVFLARHHGSNLNFAPITTIFNPQESNESIMTVMFYEQLKIYKFYNFFPQNHLMHEKQKILKSPDQISHWNFINLKSSQHHQSKLIRTTMSISKDNCQYKLLASFSSFNLVCIILVSNWSQNEIS